MREYNAAICENLGASARNEGRMKGQACFISCLTSKAIDENTTALSFLCT